jgi:hypothetical protein
VAPEATSAAPAAVAPVSDASPFAAFAEAPPAPPGAFPFAAPEAPASRPVRRRRRKAKFSPIWFLPILLGAVLAGIIGYVVWPRPEPAPQGEIAAKTLPGNASIPPVEVVAPEGVDEAKVKATLDRLANVPEALVSQLMRVELRGGQKGLIIRVDSTEQTEVVVLDVRKHPGIRKLLEEKGPDMERARSKEYGPGLRSFFEEMGSSTGIAASELPAYRDRMALPALTEGLGYATVAVVGKVAYRCVREDAEGRLYFVLPTGTRQLELRARELEEKKTLYAETFPVQWEGPPASEGKTDAPPAERTEPGEKTEPGDGEMAPAMKKPERGE